MKIKELIAALKDMDQNAEVILQKDSEGNGYSHLYGITDEAVYVPETTYSGLVYYTDWSAEDADMSEAEWKKLLKKKRCVVLIPTN